MSPSSYITAVEQAEAELKALMREHAELLRRMEWLQTFIKTGRAIAGEIRVADAAPPVAAAGLFSEPAPTSTFVDGPAESLANASLPEAVAHVLKAAGRPLHLRDIEKRVSTFKKIKSARPQKALWIAINRRTDMFKRVSPNTYELVQRAVQ